MGLALWNNAEEFIVGAERATSGASIRLSDVRNVDGTCIG